MTKQLPKTTSNGLYRLRLIAHIDSDDYYRSINHITGNLEEHFPDPIGHAYLSIETSSENFEQFGFWPNKNNRLIEEKENLDFLTKPDIGIVSPKYDTPTNIFNQSVHIGVAKGPDEMYELYRLDGGNKSKPFEVYSMRESYITEEQKENLLKFVNETKANPPYYYVFRSETKLNSEFIQSNMNNYQGFNCTSFALEGWEVATGEKILTMGEIYSPTQLIEELEGVNIPVADYYPFIAQIEGVTQNSKIADHLMPNDLQNDFSSLKEQLVELDRVDNYLLNPEAKILGWTEGKVLSLATERHEKAYEEYVNNVNESNVTTINRPPTLGELSREIAKEININSETSIKSSFQDIHSYFNGVNGKEIAELYTKRGFVDKSDFELSEKATKAGYDINHHVQFAGQLFYEQPADAKDFNLAIEQSKKFIEKDSLSIINGASDFTSLPILDDATKEAILKEADSLISNAAPTQTQTLSLEIKDLNKLLSKTGLTYEDVKAQIQSATDIKDIPEIKAHDRVEVKQKGLSRLLGKSPILESNGYAAKVEKQFCRIEEQSLKMNEGLQTRVDNFKNEISSIYQSPETQKALMRINATSNSSLQAHLNLSNAVFSGSAPNQALKELENTNKEVIKASQHLNIGSSNINCISSSMAETSNIVNQASDAIINSPTSLINETTKQSINTNIDTTETASLSM